MDDLFRAFLFILGGLTAIFLLYMILSEEVREINRKNNKRARYREDIKTYKRRLKALGIDDEAIEYSLGSILSHKELKRENRRIKKLLDERCIFEDLTIY